MNPARQQLIVPRRAVGRPRSAGRADLVVLTLLALFALMALAVPAAWLLSPA
jgi:hypothetical protein